MVIKAKIVKPIVEATKAVDEVAKSALGPAYKEAIEKAPAVKEAVETERQAIEETVAAEIIKKTEEQVQPQIEPEVTPTAEPETVPSPVVNPREETKIDEISAEPVASQTSLEPAPTIVADIKKQVEAAANQPKVISQMQFDSAKELDTFLQKNAGININKPGPVSNVETDREAVKMLADGMDVPATVLAQNGILNAAQVRAAAEIMKAIQDENYRLSLLLEDPAKRTPALELQLREGLMKEAAIRNYFMGARSEVGRTLQIFKQLKKTLEADTSLYTSNRIGQEFGGETGNISKGYINAYNNSKTQPGNRFAETQKFAEASYGQRLWAGFKTVYYASMLSNPATQMVNLLGNLGFQSISPIEYTIAGLINTIEKKTLGQVNNLLALTNMPGKKLIGGMLKEMEGSIQAREGATRLYGMVSAIPAAFRVAYHAMKTGERSGSGRSRIGLDESEFIMRPPVQKSEMDAFTGDKLLPERVKGLPGSNVVSMIIDAIGKVLNIPGMGLLGGDEFFKTIARHAELHSLAAREMSNVLEQGGSKEQAIEKAAFVLANPNAKFDKDLDEAADFFTFQSMLDPAGQSTKGIQRIPGMILVVPFFDTIWNIMKVTGTYTPGVNLVPLAIEESKFLKDSLISAYPEYYASWQRSKRDPEQLGKLKARVLMSSAVGLMVWHMLEDGHMIGAAPRDPAERTAFYDAGKKPFSFVFKDGDWEGPKFDENGVPNGPLVYRSFARIEPFSGALGITAAAWENIVYYSKQDPSGYMVKYIPMAYAAAVQEYATDQPFLKGIATLSNLFTGPPRTRYQDDPVSIFDRDFGEIIGNPINAIMGAGVTKSILNSLDPELKVSDPDYDQDLEIWSEPPSAENNFQGTLNPEFGKFNPNSAYNQFDRIIFNAFKVYNKDVPKRIDLFGKTITKDSYRGKWNNVRNVLLPMPIYDAEQPDPVRLELLRLHATIGWNGMVTDKNATLFSTIRLNQSQTINFYSMQANNNGELAQFGLTMPLEDYLGMVMNSLSYQEPLASKSFEAWQPNFNYRNEVASAPDEYRKYVLETALLKYKKAAQIAFYQNEVFNGSELAKALQEYAMVSQFNFPTYTKDDGTEVSKNFTKQINAFERDINR
tara:strand:- start:1073 stop:4417 length:3345 start_codon:yes stop_codon:yes gene_type:complete